MNRFTKALLPLLLAINCGAQTGGLVTVTLAGNGTAAYTGDGGSSLKSQVSGPKDICVDAANNFFFIDKGNARIRKISARGDISTIAGGGASYLDGVVATTAAITPNYLCLTSKGDILFTTDDKIRKIDMTTGLISTVAGTSSGGYTGDGGLAISATLANPQGICTDVADNIYVIDRGNNAIRKITASTGKITTITGGLSAGYTGDSGPAIAAHLYGPVCVTASPTGDIYFSDQNPNYPGYDNSVIRKIDALTGIVTTISGATPTISPYQCLAKDAILGTTTGLYFRNGELFCCEMSCSCRKINFTTDTLYRLAGDFGIESYSNDTSSPLANMNIPYGLCVDAKGDIFVADSGNQRIRKIIQLSHTPAFAYGRGVYIDPAVGSAFPIDSIMWVTDLDVAQKETWTVVTAPLHGTLAGFPTSAVSRGDSATTKPLGLSYTPSPSYKGADFFRVQISDGANVDTVTVYVGPKGTDAPLSAPTTVAASGVSVFPNPATSMINVQLPATLNGSAITVIDIAGHVVRDATCDNGSAHVNVTSLPAGVYFVNTGAELCKFVKE